MNPTEIVINLGMVSLQISIPLQIASQQRPDTQYTQINPASYQIIT